MVEHNLTKEEENLLLRYKEEEKEEEVKKHLDSFGNFCEEFWLFIYGQ